MPPVFEHTTSPLYQSNDGKLRVVRGSFDSLPSEATEVIDLDLPSGERTLLRTYERAIADAYIAGYDEARRKAEEGS
jgi:hypothetical protein